mmetsp:Transcript_21728/g.69067  ORF Transcript_21728/g.69067 Transcript_21728/m.69067 type:complete len:243 (+) Transcript_21728:179-907(+)
MSTNAPPHRLSARAGMDRRLCVAGRRLHSAERRTLRLRLPGQQALKTASSFPLPPSSAHGVFSVRSQVHVLVVDRLRHPHLRLRLPEPRLHLLLLLRHLHLLHHHHLHLLHLLLVRGMLHRRWRRRGGQRAVHVHHQPDRVAKVAAGVPQPPCARVAAGRGRSVQVELDGRLDRGLAATYADLGVPAQRVALGVHQGGVQRPRRWAHVDKRPQQLDRLPRRKDVRVDLLDALLAAEGGGGLR